MQKSKWKTRPTVVIRADDNSKCKNSSAKRIP